MRDPFHMGRVSDVQLIDAFNAMRDRDVLEIDGDEESGFDIVYYGNTWMLFEIPQYGGHPRFVDVFHRNGAKGVVDMVSKMRSFT